jgi:hypothetical protein
VDKSCIKSAAFLSTILCNSDKLPNTVFISCTALLVK